MVHKFYNGKIILGNTFAPEGTALYTKDDRILAITDQQLPFDVAHDVQGKYISPGFIDMHVHGGNGYDLRKGELEAFIEVSKLHSKHGTTVMLPSGSSGSVESYIKMFNTLDEYNKINAEKAVGAHMPGLHLEGPYFAPVQAGAQIPKYMTPPKPEDYMFILENYGDKLIRWSSAPELPGAKEFVKALREYDVVAAIGHSDADYDCVMQAYDWGYTMINHFYSGCSTVHRKNAYRYAGIVEAGYMIDGMDVEIIADGRHLPASLLKFVVKFKGVDRIALITDAIACAGLPDGSEKLFENPTFIIEDGVAKLPDRSVFAGSVCTTDRLVRNMIQLAEVSVLDAVRMASANPARICKLRDRGHLREGNFADIVVFDEDINVSLTMVNGRVVFEA